MITLTINGQKEQIPTFDELTCKQFMKMRGKDINLVNYLSIVLDKSYKAAFNSKVKNDKKLIKRLGTFSDFTTLRPESKFIVKDRLYYTKAIDISTVGQRWTIEENARKLQDEELLCFILAVGMVKDPMNFEDITEMKEKLMNEPYKKILPIAFFLASRFSIGKISVMNYLRMLKQQMKMRVYELQQVFRSLEAISTITKYKRYASY